MKLTEAEWFASRPKVEQELYRLNLRLVVSRIINRGDELLRRAALEQEGK